MLTIKPAEKILKHISGTNQKFTRIVLLTACFMMLGPLKSQASDFYIVGKISFSGLDKTKPQILEVELNIHQGDTILHDHLDSILNNQCIKFYNLQLFHWVKNSIEKSGSNLNIEFKFQERWYLWPIPIFSLADRNISSWIKHRSLDRIDYGLHILHTNFLGRNQKLKSNLQSGYNQKYEAFYTIPYVDSSRTIGLDFAISTYRSHFSDAQILNGNPINTELSDDIALRIDYLSAGIFKRKNVNQITNANVVFQSIAISDSIFSLNPEYFIRDPNKINTSSQFLNLFITHKINKRATFSYPRNGYYIQLMYHGRMDLKYGFGNLHEASAEVALYKSVFKNKLVLSTGGYAKAIQLKENNFLDTRMLGYKKYLRGFEYNIIHGNVSWIHKNQAMYNVLPSRTIKLGIIPSEKFNEIPLSIYAGAHLDWGYVYSKNDRWTSMGDNLYANTLLTGAGIGVHFVTYYDRVLVLEYTFNNFGNNGLYISTSFPI